MTRLLSNLLCMTLVCVCLSLAANGCRDDGKPNSDESSGDNSTPVGTQVCMQCHYDFPANQYVSGDATDSDTSSPTFYDNLAKAGIGENYQLAVHYTPSTAPTATDYVKCEGCHGNGSKHQGIGQIPYPAPGIDRCGQCHAEPQFALAVFKTIRHANADATPDRFFLQGGSGTEQATLDGQPEFQSDGTPVNKDQHIHQCSVCHSYSTKISHIQKGISPSPPQVHCASCHDPHRPAAHNRNEVPSRTRGEAPPGTVINFKPQRVNNDASGDQFGAKNLMDGTWIRPRMHYNYVHSDYTSNAFIQTYLGYKWQRDATTDGGLGAGDWLRLSPERLCAACHTKGKYLYVAYKGATPVTETHQPDIFTQYRSSGHADKNGAWRQFSLLGSPDSSRRPQYPIDMAYSTNPNHAVNTSRNNFSCYQCHHGIGSIDFQKGVQAGLDATNDDSDAAHILWGDSTNTCITCHAACYEQNPTGVKANIRVPKYLAYSPEFTPQYTPGGVGNWRGGSSSMLDLTPIPANVGSSVICLFCHQGRSESSWTVWNKIRRADATTDIGSVNGPDFAYADASQDSIIAAGGQSLISPHDLPSAGLLWSKNFWEFIPNGNPANAKIYTNGDPSHQSANCAGCHMGEASPDNTVGGHTWRPNIKTCQATGCHPGLTGFFDLSASGNYDGDNNASETSAQEIGTIALIPLNYAVPGTNLVWNDASPDLGGSGLLQLVNRALYEKGVRLSSTSGSCQFWNSTASYNRFTPRLLEVAFNVGSLLRAGNARYVHNVPYAAQILIDCLEKLGYTTSPTPFGGNPFFRPVTPVGGTTRPAADYRLLLPVQGEQ